MSVSRLFKVPIVYHNKKYIDFGNVEYYPISSYNKNIIDCIQIRHNEKPTQIRFCRIPLDALMTFLYERNEIQVYHGYATSEEYKIGIPFIFQRNFSHLYISIGDNFAIELPYGQYVNPRIIDINEESVDNKRYILNKSIAKPTVEWFLKSIKRKDSIFDTIQTYFSDRATSYYCKELKLNYGSYMGLDIKNYYVRRSLEKILSRFLQSE